MILAFANDSTVIAVDGIDQVRTYCEEIDVQDGVWTFIDQHGKLFRPSSPKRPEGRIARSWWAPDSFTLTPTEHGLPDLLQAVFDGAACVDPGPRIRTREELIQELAI